ncbi:MAG TPA: sensor histidine kinase [Nannocystis exedens]|nr:sensor histidine kinase [Nannocystis exedens]
MRAAGTPKTPETPETPESLHSANASAGHASGATGKDSGLALHRTLGARLLPLAVLLALVVSTTAPLAYLALTLEGVRVAAESRAHEIARELRREVEERPILWRYGSAKLFTHLNHTATSAGLLTIAVVDRDGRPIDLDLDLGTRAPPQVPALWVSAPLTLHGEPVADVWVAADPRPAIGGALRLLLGFGILGLGVGGLVYWLPMRAIGRAESRIVALIDRLGRAHSALEELNATLELQVAERSHELLVAYETLRGKEEHLRALSGRAVALQEAERRVIARELHDSAGQALTAIRIHLQLIAQSCESPEVVARLAVKTQTITDATLEEIRRAVTMLGPAILDDVGLEAAIERLCDDLREDDHLNIIADVELRDGRPLTPALESTIYRLVQESLTNIARHAQAREARVEIVPTSEAVLLTIRDDGCGFSVKEAIGKSRSHGLIGMRERAELLGGDLEIRSRPGEGTVVTARLPHFSVASDGDDSALIVA